MPYTTLGSATAGQVYTASAHNAIIGNLNALGPAAFNVQAVTKTDVFTSNSTSYTDVTGLSVSITPSSATSKVLVIVSLAMTTTAAAYSARAQIVRGSTAIGGGTAAGNRPSASFYSYYNAGTREPNPKAHFVLDSPATTSSTTYKIQGAVESGGTFAINRSDGGDGDNVVLPRLASSIVLVEIPV